MSRSEFEGLVSKDNLRELDAIHRKIDAIGKGKRSMDEFGDLLARVCEILATDEVLAMNKPLRAKLLATTERYRKGVGPPLPRRQVRTR